jgi:ribosomal protein S18 acetylase RimI-like enzyme
VVAYEFKKSVNMEKRGSVRKYISKFIDTKNLIIKDATMDECGELQHICSTWEDKELIEGDCFESNYILKCITEGDLPPIQDASKKNYCLKSIYSKHHCNIIGFIDIYHGYPKSNTLWISIFVLHKGFHNKAFGQEVMKSLEKDAAETIYCKVGLAVHLRNWKALRFWTRAGFDKVIGIYGDKVFGQDNYALIGLEKSLE